MAFSLPPKFVCNDLNPINHRELYTKVFSVILVYSSLSFAHITQHTAGRGAGIWVRRTQCRCVLVQNICAVRSDPRSGYPSISEGGGGSYIIVGQLGRIMVATLTVQEILFGTVLVVVPATRVAVEVSFLPL